MLGLVVAFVGILLRRPTASPGPTAPLRSASASFWAIAAIFLAIETKGLLIGEAAAPEIVETIRNIVLATPTVAGMNELRTLHRGPEDILLALSLDFEDNLTAGKVEEAIQALETAIRDQFPTVGRVFIEVQSRRGHQAIDGGGKRHRLDREEEYYMKAWLLQRLRGRRGPRPASSPCRAAPATSSATAGATPDASLSFPQLPRT